jgi:hypothetical protein
MVGGFTLQPQLLLRRASGVHVRLLRASLKFFALPAHHEI